MRHRLGVLSAFVLLAAFLLPVGLSAAPQPPFGDPNPPAATIDNALRAKGRGQVKVVVELADAPSVQAFAELKARGQSLQATTAAKQQLVRIDRAQQRLLPLLAQAQAKVLYRTQRVYNGIGVLVDSSKLPQIARMPGVKALHQLITKHLDNASSVQLIGAPQLWGAATPLTGAGIKLGVIDTGVDYIHTDFGGSGLQADYDLNDTTAITDTSVIKGNPPLFPNARVVGGYDFAGDDYDADDSSSLPQPDPDPMDCEGHGSHVTGTAAGSGVNADGSTYTGAYGPATPFGSMRIGPGVAPQAQIYALRVFGCGGSTDLADQAIEWAADPNGDGDFSDHLDVINMSLGSDFGGSVDSTSIASENAVKAGVIVVASAGNSSDTNFITGSPGSADSVISVASSVDAADVLDGIKVNAPAAIAGVKAAAFSVAYDWASKPNVTGNVVYPPSQRDGCAAYSSANKALINGKIVIVDWTDGACGSVARTANVVAAGGIGAILVDNSDVFDLSITGSAVIPAVSMPKTIGDLLKANLAGLNVTFSNSYKNSTTLTNNANTDTLSVFSSRGPSRSGGLKPDISAPGQSIFSVEALTGNQGTSLNGTSMAAPHIAGAMVLLRQLHPTWTVAELKALAMNTATNNLRSASAADSQAYGPSRVGAGRVDLVNAAAQSVIAFDAAHPNQVGLTFGTLEVTNTATLAKQVTVQNKGASAVTYDLGYAPSTIIPGVSYSVSPAQVTLAAGSSATATITLNATAANMKHTHDPTIAETQVGEARHWLSEASGYLTMTPPAANAQFTAAVHGYNENPPVDSSYSAKGTFVYTDSTSTLGYDIRFTTPVTITAGHIHRGAAGINDPVAAYPISSGGTNITRLAGNVVLTAADKALLLSGGLYVNFHTTANPGGELRGQIVATAPALRLPVYVAARPASQMSAQQSTLPLSSLTVPTATTAITLVGTGLNTGNNLPVDEKSLVTAFELQDASPAIVAATLTTSVSDLQYVGVGSTYSAATAVPDATVYFGITTFKNWATPIEAEFDIYIDTNLDGSDDYVIYNTSRPSGPDGTDVFISRVIDLSNNQASDGGYINGVDAAAFNTVLFNTNAMVLPVPASALGLADGSSRFNYQVVSFAYGQSASVDSTPVLTYDIAKPGVAFSGGIAGLATFFDLPGAVIDVNYDRANLISNRSKGILLIHHHNLAGKHAEVVNTPQFLMLPLIRR